VQETYETDVTVTSLEPYTLYTVQVKASNFYSDTPVTLSQGNVDYFMTKPGSKFTIHCQVSTHQRILRSNCS